MLRPAATTDLARLAEIRDGAGSDALSDPALLTEENLARLVAGGAGLVWHDAGRIAGFAAVDSEAIHLLVDPAHRGRGVGRELLAAACARIKQKGGAAATVSLAPDGSAARHYRAAGWRVIREESDGRLILQKPL